MAGKYRPVPVVTHECLACSFEFQGTPKATRCTTCRASGRKVPKDKQAHQFTQSTYRKAPIVRLDLLQHDKACGACGQDFQTHKPKAARCNDCIVAGNPTRTRSCLECKQKFTLTDDLHVNCQACAAMLEIEQDELTPAQQAAEIEAAHQSNHQDQLKRQTAWLDAREKAPKGYPKLNHRTYKITLGVLWLQICAADGQAASIMFAAKPCTLDEDEKVMLLTTFYRLRAKGFHPSAIAKLCPKAILKDEAQSALNNLPKVEEQHRAKINQTPDQTRQTINASNIEGWGRVASAVNLGLNTHTPT